MSYGIPLANGNYTVYHHFTEIWFGAKEGETGVARLRIFDVSLESVLMPDNIDIYVEVGAQTKLVKSFATSLTDGVLNIDFSSLAADGGARHPTINGIEIVEGGRSTAKIAQ
ncbi:MAG: malectin domain-containing carbohydrate-binding protein [Eudoraea sp.]|uniref:malectin domain-containing carbohydrate-binding protein n=1 Tax=Eudoraea sp. TaxID=1979955 RepID=UPI003C73C0AE